MRIDMMRPRALLFRAALAGSLAAAACSSTSKESIVPPQTVEMDAETLRKFQHEVEEYVELRQAALKQIPPISAGSTPAQIEAHQKALTGAIIAYRKGAKRGEIFKPEVESAIRRTLHREFTSAQGPELLKGIKQGNPRVEGNPTPRDPSKEVMPPINIAVNVLYPESAAFSSIPPSLLLKLPLLPEQVRYRFIGRTLILRDTEANVILDYIPDVVPDQSIPR
jgi:hypothetical protein